MTRAARASLALCAVPLLGCEQLVGLRELVPVDATVDEPRLPVAFDIVELGTQPINSGLQEADVNNDGRPDLVFYEDAATSERSMLLNTTEANDTVPSFMLVSHPFPAWDRQPGSFVDVNGDHELDYVVLLGDGSFRASLNTTSPGTLMPTFDPLVSFDFIAAQLVLRFADLDGDGTQDVIGAASNTVRIALNSTPTNASTPVFAPSVAVPVGDANDLVTILQIADINGDGKPDLVVVTRGAAGAVWVAINRSTPGTVTFDPAVVVPISRPYAYFGCIVTDFDDDGLPDLIVQDGDRIGSPQTGVALTNRTSIGSAAPVFVESGLDDLPSLIQDVDGDGRPDLLYTGLKANSEADVMINFTPKSAATPVFAPALSAGPAVAGHAPQSIIAVSDLNHDGKVDFVVTERADTEITVAVLLSKPLPP